MRYLLLLVLLFPLSVHAQYKCLAPDGVTEYRSTPCPTNSKPLNQGVVMPGPSTQPSGPTYWQREAARLEQKEAQERADRINAQRASDAAYQTELAARQAAANQALAEQQAAEDRRLDKVELQETLREQLNNCSTREFGGSIRCRTPREKQAPRSVDRTGDRR